MPCDITFWGKQENEQEVIQRMRRHGYMLRIFREPIPSKSGMPGNSVAAMGVGRPPSIKISQDQVLRCIDLNFIYATGTGQSHICLSFELHLA